MKDLNKGITGTSELTVTDKDLAVNVGSGSLEVLATPVMIMLMEKAACTCIAEFLEGDETTVGTEMNVKHISATPNNMKVCAEAELTEINGRELVFTVKAYDEAGDIGEGIHKRFLVYGDKFTAKANSKI
ncbi:thioesterase family protein [Ruminococcus flavefaciens]|uniref:thioesterase family protein n=1 Tax=Ruminococcus flavefaciens TaxID=1265 RepID=UPI0026F024F5|nr:thioesterase family protein [Ruminococcus flavefaciens]MDD7516395.1 thioesterase family protein [Ruminococcus flavefaciens]MDY5691077.1 thioesterase family protein [Ruminococcus flavefaciens]